MLEVVVLCDLSVCTDLECIFLLISMLGVIGRSCPWWFTVLMREISWHGFYNRDALRGIVLVDAVKEFPIQILMPATMFLCPWIAWIKLLDKGDA